MPEGRTPTKTAQERERASAAAWAETERLAAEAGGYWRKHFQTVTPRLRASRDRERVIKSGGGDREWVRWFEEAQREAACK